MTTANTQDSPELALDVDKTLARVERDLSLALSESRDLQQALESCIDAVFAVSGMRCGGGIYLLDQKGGLSLAVHRGFSDSFIEAVSYCEPESPNTVAVLKAEPIFVDPGPVADVDPAGHRHLEGIFALAVLPILDRGRVVACLNIGSKAPATISPRVRASLEAIASRLGATIEKFRTLARTPNRDADLPLTPASGMPATRDMQGTILVVDDEKSVRVPCERFVQRLGFCVVGASSGEEALRILAERAGEIVLVILDLSMPGLDGVATYHEVRRLAPALPVILSSGYGEEDAMQGFGEARPQGFLQKPYALSVLRATIETILSAPSPA